MALRQIDLGRARMAYVACGYRHTLAISDEGALFAFGWNACVASLRTRNRPHHATDTVQHATELDASCNSVVAALFAFGSHCRSALRHCGTAARLCNAVSTHGPELSMRQSTKHFLASAFVCAQLRATRHQRKYGFDSLSMDAQGNDRELHSYRCHASSRSNRLRVGGFVVLCA